jgi:hypothetical protein
MSQVIKGRELEIYTGDGIRAIGCSSACTLTLTTNEIITTSLGSGAATNREYGGYDWSVSSNGVLVIQDEFDGTGKLDPLEFAAYILQGIKVAVKFQITDEKYYFGTGIIKSASYQGQADNFALFTVEILADGELTPTSNLVSPLTGTYSTINIINVIIRDSDEYQNDLLIGATIIDIYSNFFLLDPSDYTLDDVTGTISFNDFINQAIVRIIYATD